MKIWRLDLHVAVLVALFCVAFPATPAGAFALGLVSNYIFVPSRASRSVTVIDRKKDVVVGTIALAFVPSQMVVAQFTVVKSGPGKTRGGSTAKNYLVATNKADATMEVVDLDSLSEVRLIHLASHPDYLLLNPDQDLVALADEKGDTVSFVSLTKLREIGKISGLHKPDSMFFSQYGRRLYIGNGGAPFISVVKVRNLRIVGRIVVAKRGKDGADAGDYRGISSVATAPYATVAFAVYGRGDKMAVIDLRTDKVKKVIDFGGAVEGAYSALNGAFMIVPNNGNKTIELLSMHSLSKVAQLPGAARMKAVDIGYIQSLGFVVSQTAREIMVIDVFGKKEIGRIRLPGVPAGAIAAPDGTKLYVALPKLQEMAVIDTHRQKLVKLIRVDGQPWGATTSAMFVGGCT